MLGRPTRASTLNAADDVAYRGVVTVDWTMLLVTGSRTHPRPRPTCFMVLGRTPAKQHRDTDLAGWLSGVMVSASDL